MLVVQKYGFGSVLGVLCVVDLVCILAFAVSAANLRQTADAITGEVHARFNATAPLAANGIAPAAGAAVEGVPAPLSDADRQQLAGAREMAALATTAAALAAYIATLDLITAVSARTTGSQTRAQRASSWVLRSSIPLLVPQALALSCLCVFALWRGKRITGNMCERNEDQIHGCFPAVKILAAALAILAALSVLRMWVTVQFNAAVKSSTERYAEMTELESAADQAAREERMATIATKHQALRDKYVAKGFLKEKEKGAS